MRKKSRLENLSIAVCALALFHAVSVASGKITVAEGLGWDGQAYAQMVTGAITDGTAGTRSRPLLILATKIPYALGLHIVTSFNALNYLYSFALYVGLCLLLDRYGAGRRAKALVVGNVALCISVSKMFAFYPVQVDLGALAVITIAFYLVATGPTWAASLGCVLAAASREFGVAVALYGIHRAIRRGESWPRTGLIYLPGVATTVLIRLWATGSAASGDTPLTVGDALENLQLWRSPAFIAVFAYFSVLVFGGISALLLLRLRWCVGRLREEPELATYLAVIVGLTAAGNLDIWRYLVFALPVAVVLMGQYCRGWGTADARRLLILMTMVTVMTQRPFERMDTEIYLRDWFPLYRYFASYPDVGGLAAIWSVRLASLIMAMSALFLVTRAAVRSPDRGIGGELAE